MRIALMGSVSSSLCALEALNEGGVNVACVLGVDPERGQSIGDYRDLGPTATQASIPYLSFRKVSDPEVRTFLLEHHPDMLWVIGLSQLVPQEVIEIASKGGVGFHPTMLPEGRGRAPVAWTILRGLRAAANLFYLADTPDSGDIIAQREVVVHPDDYSEDLIQRTNETLRQLVLELAPRLKSGDLPRTPQDHSKATYLGRRTPADGIIDWTQSTDSVYRLVRAAGRPYHGAFTFLGKQKVIIWKAHPIREDAQRAQKLPRVPGEVFVLDDGARPVVGTSDGALVLTEATFQDGGSALQAAAPGTRFESKETSWSTYVSWL